MRTRVARRGLAASARSACIASLCAFLVPATSAEGPPRDEMGRREALRKAMDDGNFKEAHDGLRELALDPGSDPLRVGDDLEGAVQCLQRLNRASEIDAFVEAVVKAHPGNWRLLQAAARTYLGVPHHGYVVAGEFQRGNRRGGGQLVNARERDRVRALQLFVQGLPAARADAESGADRSGAGAYVLFLADALLDSSGGGRAWRLQDLTDLSSLPDTEPGWGYSRDAGGAPVDADGKPVFHRLPETFEAAGSDGERWRWCLQEAMELNPGLKASARLRFADFLRSQFGVQTLATYGWRFGSGQDDDSEAPETGTWALHTLGEGETIARLATGVRRFDLPDEFNHLRVYREIADSGKGWEAVESLGRLAEAFENRRQYPRAVEVWRRLIQEYPEAQARSQWQDRLDQIVGSWGRFEPIQPQPSGRGATVEFRYRNARSVELVATAIDVEKLLADVKAHIKSKPNRLDWDRVNIADLGYRLVQEGQKEYLGAETARWKVDLEPREAHFDKRITLTTPLQKAGAYLLTASVAGGNTSHIVVWVADTVIVKKPLPGKTLYWVADAVTGTPIAKANLELFGYEQRWVDGNRVEIRTSEFAELSDADGLVTPDPKDQPPGYQWVIIARTREGRLAYLGFTGVWYAAWHDAEYSQVKCFGITDRPVYRPAQASKYKFWIGHAKYDVEDRSAYAGQEFTVEVHDAKGEKVAEETRKADEWGGIEGEVKLAADAALGVWRLGVRQGPRGFGGATFRVEEYKKPEFEVTVEAPKEPVALGEKVEATVRAKYYFGSPVTEARVKYKVLRTGYIQRWYAPGRWDWLYGPGYWWYAYEYDWYPGFRDWGCRRPIPFWWWAPREQPEVVAESEGAIGEDGTVKVEIDTSLAKAIHGDEDHRYSITAEVVDASRRTIVGTGEVIVARKPFKVHAWVDRGHYRVGDTIRASFSALTPDSKPVEGKGELSLLQLRYDGNRPVETVVQTWKVELDATGRAERQIRASRAGQYRLSCRVTDAKGRSIEGGYLLTVVGEGFDGSQFRFSSVEVIPEKREYAPGETVRLQVNTDRVGSTVLLFVRPSNGVYLPPKVLRLEGKSVVEEIEVVKKDTPNFFVEALTVADAKVHAETREIVVPPEERILSVEVKPTSDTYRPGEDAKVQVHLTDLSGEPFVGSTVVAIYDKSVEYISGGSNVPEIKAFFWKWRRQHRPGQESSLDRLSGNLFPKDARGMGDIGVFGAEVPEAKPSSATAGIGGGRGGGAGFGARAGKGAAPAAPAAANRLQAMEMADGVAMDKLESNALGEGGGGEAAVEVEAAVRKEFADTALWVAALETSKDGTAEVSLKMPENLTTWRVRVWGMGAGTRVGEGSTDVVTRKDLILRLQAPRFFVEKDEVVLSANIHNYLGGPKSVRAVLELEGGTIEALSAPSQEAVVEAGSEARIDWRVKVVREGEAVVRMKALTDEESDAMEMRFPCKVHGMLKTESWSGAMRPEDTSAKVVVRVPVERRPEQTRLEVRWSPTLAGAMVDALPYLADYPYGCTEQTLNRFLPAAITRKVLLEMGLDLGAIRDKRTNLNAQEVGDDRERAKRWQRFDRNPVFDEAEVARMVKDGVKRLTEMQLSDGGWGWFSGWGERSSAHTTAVVVHGLLIARANDVALVPGVLERGVSWLERHQAAEVSRLENALKEPKVDPWKGRADNVDALVATVLVEAGGKDRRMLEFLYRDRTELAVYSLAMIGLAYDAAGDREKRDMAIRNIGQYLREDDENQTAWLDLPGGHWWHWYGSEYEAHASYLKLLARTDPKGRVAPRLVKYLLSNRKHATYWNSTRDTALCVEAFAEFIRASGEGTPELTVEVRVDGKEVKAVEITPANLFAFDNKLVLEGEALTAGEHAIELVKKGKGPLYFNAYLTNFTLEDFIARAGLEVKVDRKYYKLERVETSERVRGSRGQSVDQKVEKYERRALPNLAVARSGDLIEVELEIESKNDYEYLVFEDMKPAGFEPVDVRSGYGRNALGAYVEFRDDRVAFFVRTLARGKHSVSYRTRAEIPGKFSALPTRAWAMYAPELRGNSDEIKIVVED